ncbi:MAG: hypothetical protein GY913_28665 [Proteobacteria bacterium]|nr:hypothetical protein [Pseudomonadota bacterium]MCP4920886.1 hypothetical protein [Pseudomonadota bacterium]
MASDLALYLRLTPEFGGTRFGPFEGSEVRLGSDPEQNDIVLPESLGVIDAHVKILRQSDDNLIVAPIDRTAAVYVWTGGAQRPRQITTPIAVQNTDRIALVTAQGPCFIIEIALLPEEIREERKKARGRRSRLTGDALKGEGKRQLWVRLISTGPGQIAMRGYTFVKSGAIFMPRNLFMIAGIGGGYALAGVQSCRKGSVDTELSLASVELGECEDRFQAAESLGRGGDEYTFTDLVGRVAIDAKLAAALERDKKLRAAVKDRAQVVLARESDYEWLINPKSGRRQAGEFATLREKLAANDGLEPETGSLLLWTAALPGAPSLKGFSVVVDSNGDQVCGRGTMGLTWRQARNLGLAAQVDALVDDPEPFQESREKREEALASTVSLASGAGEWTLEEDVEAAFAPIRQGNKTCMYVDGTDQRDSLSTLVSKAAKELGSDGEGLPNAAENHHSAAAVAKFYAADLGEVDLRASRVDFDFTSVPSVAMDRYAAKEWVLDRTAEVIARSVILPCMARLKYGGNAELENVFGENMPNPQDCLMLEWKIRNEE